MADSEHERAAPPGAQELGRKWLELGQSYLAAMAEYSARAGGSREPQAQNSGPSEPLDAGPFDTGRGVLEAWHRAWAGMNAVQASASQTLSDWLASMPALGPAREHGELLRELAAAQAECRRLEQELSTMLMDVQSAALKLLEQRLGGAGQGASKPAGYREIYDLWVECGEQAYAQVAHSEAYCRLQGALGNATMRLRSRQQALIEQCLKHFDLPTRSELNTLHLQMRELRRKVAVLESGTQTSAAQGKPGRRKRAKPSE